MGAERHKGQEKRRVVASQESFGGERKEIRVGAGQDATSGGACGGNARGGEGEAAVERESRVEE